MPDIKIFKIISDGTPAGTKIIDPHGNVLKNVASVSIEMQPGVTIAKITITATNPSIDILAGGEVINRA